MASSFNNGSTPSARVNESMMAAMRAAESMAKGAKRDSVIAAVTKAAAELNKAMDVGTNARGYKNLEGEGPSCMDQVLSCPGFICGGLWSLILGFYNFIVGIFKFIHSAYVTLRTPVLYYAFGCLAYYYLEGWSALDTSYFLSLIHI